MANMGRALMSGLVQGFGKYANMQYDEKQKAEQAERDQELAKLQQQVKQADAEFQQGLKPAEYQTFEVQGEDGKTYKRTVKSSYDKDKGRVEETVGESVVEPKEKRAETAIEMYQRDPEAYADMQARARRPLMGSRDESPEKAPKASTLTSAEMDAMFGTVDRNGVTTVDPKAYRQFLGYQARNSANDPKFRDAKYAAQQWANQVGVDPEEELPGAFRVDTPSMESASEKPSAPVAPSPQAKPVGADKAAAKSKAGDNPPEVQALIAQAEKAIQGGADAEKVKARLNDMLKSKGYSLK